MATEPAFERKPFVPFPGALMAMLSTEQLAAGEDLNKANLWKMDLVVLQTRPDENGITYYKPVGHPEVEPEKIAIGELRRIFGALLEKAKELDGRLIKPANQVVVDRCDWVDATLPNGLTLMIGHEKDSAQLTIEVVAPEAGLQDVKLFQSPASNSGRRLDGNPKNATATSLADKTFESFASFQLELMGLPGVDKK